MMQQLVTPNPDIEAEEGMCLQYVRQAFDLPLRYGSATEAWNKSPTQHQDRDYPTGVWFPVWWALDKNVNGHVALVAPDGSVYSTSNLAPNPVKHHPSIDHVETYYAYYGMTLTWRGWTEDVAGYPVITNGGIAAMGTITPEEDMPLTKEDVDNIAARVVEVLQPIEDVTRQFLADRTKEATAAILNGTQAQSDVTRQYLADRIKDTPPADLAAQINAAGIAEAVRDELVKLIGGTK
jgi:hypothetical protein